MATRNHEVPETQDIEKENELRIINILRQNARMSMAKISEKTSIPVGTLARKAIDVRNKYIIRYSSLIDFDKLGYFVGALFIIKPERGSAMPLLEFLEGSSVINNLSRTSDDRLIAEAYFRNMAEFVDFRHFVDEFAEDVAEHEIISEVVKEKFLSDMQTGQKQKFI